MPGSYATDQAKLKTLQFDETRKNLTSQKQLANASKFDSEREIQERRSGNSHQSQQQKRLPQSKADIDLLLREIEFKMGAAGRKQEEQHKELSA